MKRMPPQFESCPNCHAMLNRYAFRFTLAGEPLETCGAHCASVLKREYRILVRQQHRDAFRDPTASASAKA